MANIIFSEIVETNMVTIVAMDDQPMNFIVRMNGNRRPIQDVIHQMRREENRPVGGCAMPG